MSTKEKLMELIPPTDPQYFEQSSYDYYDRHDYKIVPKIGKSLVVDSWEKANEIWWNSKPFLSHIEVLDKKQESKGFK